MSSTIETLYDANGPFRGFIAPGMMAWALGAAVFFAAGSIGGTLPALAVSIGAYALITRLQRNDQRRER